MKLKFDTHYVVITPNELTQRGDTLLLRKQNNGSLGDYLIFLPVKNDQETFFGLPLLNNVLYFKTLEEVEKALEGVEVLPNKYLARKLIADLQSEIDKIKDNHDLNDW